MKLLVDGLRVHRDWEGVLIWKGKHYFDSPETWYSDYGDVGKIINIKKHTHSFTYEIEFEKDST